MLKRIVVIAAREAYQRNLLVILAGVLRFLQRTFFKEVIVKSKRSDLSQPEKIIKIIEHVNYSIRYCKISLFIYSGSSNLSNAWPF